MIATLNPAEIRTLAITAAPMYGESIYVSPVTTITSR